MALAPWQRRKLQEQHQKAAAAVRQPVAGVLNNTDRQFQVALENDITRLTNITSHARRDEVKRAELLPRYRDYLTALLESDKAGQNWVVVHNMIWALDAQEFDWAIVLGEFAIRHGMQTPDNYKRDVKNILAGQLADWCLGKLKIGHSPEPWATHIFERSRSWDLVNQIEAALLRLQAELLVTTDPCKALDYADRAYELDDKSGAIPLIRRLRKELLPLTDLHAPAE